MVRLRGPAELAGYQVLQGTFWENGSLRTTPEIISEAGLVVVQRDFAKHTSAYELVIEEARRQEKRVIYELDDLLCELPVEHPDHDYYLSARSTILRSALEADAVVTGSHRLKDYIQAFNPNVRVFANALDDRLWKMVAPGLGDAEQIVIGYQGGHSHAYDLDVVTPALLNLLEKYRGRIAFKFWGIAPPPPMRDLPNVEWLDVGLVRYADFAEYFVQQKCDIFIAPLRDNLFNRCKSALKFLEYSALGAPGVYSLVAPYENAVQHGTTGFLASNLEEWETALTSLIEDRELRFRIGVQAQAEVRARWLLSQNVENWAKIYRQLAQDDLEPANFVHGQNAAQKLSTWHQELSIEFAAQKTIQAERSAEIEQALQEPRTQILALNSQVSNLQDRLEEISRVNQALLARQDETSQALNDLQDQLELQHNANQALRVQNAEKEQRAAELDRNLQHLHQVYYEILNSRSWRLMHQFQRVRLKLIPKDGRLEFLIKKGLQAPTYIRREGLGAFLQTGWSKLRHPTPTPAPLVSAQRVLDPAEVQAAPGDEAALPASLAIQFAERSACKLPAIAVVALLDAPSTSSPGLPELAALQSWLAQQTYAWAACLCAWDRSAGRAWVVDPSSPMVSTNSIEPWTASNGRQSWQAANSQEFLDGLPASYVCFASEDLLAQEPTYLETNLLALETEGLAFSVNLRGSAQWAVGLLQKGFLPGSTDLPALRQVIRKDCLGENLQLDLGAWLRKRKGAPDVAGKILFLITNREDPLDSLPFDVALFAAPGASSRIRAEETREKPQSLLLGRNILVRARSDIPWNTVSLGLFSPDAVLPVEPSPADLPTMIMVMPFLAVGGAELLHYKILQQLKDRLRIIVLTFEDFNRQLGTTADDFRKLTPYVYDLANFVNPALNWALLCTMIERYQVASLYIANGTPWIYDAIGELKRKYPSMRVVDQVYDHKVGWINRYDLSVVMYLDGHISSNARISEAYIEKGALAGQVFLVENGVDPQEINPADYPPEKIQALKARFGIEAHQKVVTFASRMHPQKRPMDFVELARRFSVANDSAPAEGANPSLPLAFMMVGDGPLGETVDLQIKKADLKNMHRLTFYRPISDVLAITDVLVLPSDFEGMPMVLIETQAMGKPVVVTDVGNNREVLERTQGGVIISRIGDIGQLADGITRMIAQPPDPQALRQATLEHFNITQVANHYYSILIDPRQDGAAQTGPGAN